MAVLSGLRVVHILCARMAASCFRAANMGDGDAPEYARKRLSSSRRASTKRFLLLIMLKRRDYAKSVRESNSDLDKGKEACVKEACVGDGVGVLRCVNSCESLVFNEDGAMRWGDRGDGEWDLDVFTCGWMIVVDWVGFVAVDNGMIDIFVEVASIERGVLVSANGDGNGVDGWGL